MKRAVCFVALSFVAIGCGPSSSTDDGGGHDAAVVDTAHDSPRDCSAVCVRSASAVCQCDMTCRGHEVTATCTTSACTCAIDGVNGASYATTACDPNEFISACQDMTYDGGVDSGTTPGDAGHDAFVATTTAPTYTTETRDITSSGVPRTYLLATPTDIATRGSLPLVFSLHGDGGTGASQRSAIPLEAHFHADTGAVFVYPNAALDNTFTYWTDAGRQSEAQFVRDVIAALHTELNVDTTHVFIVGFSGGATMTNAIACLLGPSVLRGAGIHSGTLYSVDGPSGPEFTYTSQGGVSCALPDAIFVWGENDMTDVSFTAGQSTRDNYLATASCGPETTSGPITPCLSYSSSACTHHVAWCPIPGMAHAVWPNAGEAIGAFFEALP